MGCSNLRICNRVGHFDCSSQRLAFTRFSSLSLSTFCNTAILSLDNIFEIPCVHSQRSTSPIPPRLQEPRPPIHPSTGLLGTVGHPARRRHISEVVGTSRANPESLLRQTRFSLCAYIAKLVSNFPPSSHNSQRCATIETINTAARFAPSPRRGQDQQLVR